MDLQGQGAINLHGERDSTTRIAAAGIPGESLQGKDSGRVLRKSGFQEQDSRDYANHHYS